MNAVVWHAKRHRLVILVQAPATGAMVRVCSALAAREGYGGVTVIGLTGTQSDAQHLDSLSEDDVAVACALSRGGGAEAWTIGKLRERGHRIFCFGRRWAVPRLGAPLVLQE